MDELEKIRQKKLKELSGQKERKEKNFNAPVKGSDDNFDEMINSNPLVLVDFWAEWCGPCKMIAPVIDALAKDYAGKILVLKINVDECPQTASRFGIMSIPTVSIFKDGKIADNIVGAVPKTVLESKLNKYL
ncbi:MAG: thioredoxin [Candidatus Bathyarchaeota archaeon]|nr:thioredoxin [Candidatus Bathyarchaeota archaeon]